MLENLTQDDHQEIVLMTGSKKEWAKYLGLDEKTASSIWIRLELKSPADFLRAHCRGDQLELLSYHGSYEKLAKYLGLSTSAVRSIVHPGRDKIVPWTEEECLELFEKYRSVRLVARIVGMTEGEVRKQVEVLELDINSLIDYSFGANSNAKGRRAELHYAAFRGPKILRDLNVEVGSQADWDFDDAEHGHVNVKSSQQYKYKAKTRKAAPDFWKISLAGAEKADVLACLCYCERMTTLVGYVILKTSDLPNTKTIRLSRADLNDIPSGKLD